MIDSDHIMFNDDIERGRVDGMAWLVFANDDRNDVAFQWDMLNRPCDTCDPNLADRLRDMPEVRAATRKLCKHCIDGRHTFPVEVVCNNCDGDGFDIPVERSSCWNCNTTGTVTLRVSVVEILPITEWLNYDPVPCVYIDPADGGGTINRDTERIKLPESAAPGMWAVKLKVSA